MKISADQPDQSSFSGLLHYYAAAVLLKRERSKFLKAELLVRREGNFAD